MQAIAVEFNYSETTFVLRASQPDHGAWVRIFTPSSEIPFAGHPNVGTAFALAALMGERGETIPPGPFRIRRRSRSSPGLFDSGEWGGRQVDVFDAEPSERLHDHRRKCRSGRRTNGPADYGCSGATRSPPPFAPATALLPTRSKRRCSESCLPAEGAESRAQEPKRGTRAGCWASRLQCQVRCAGRRQNSACGALALRLFQSVHVVFPGRVKPQLSCEGCRGLIRRIPTRFYSVVQAI